MAIQPLDDGRCAVVAHSTGTFAGEHLNVYGSRSSIAKHLGSAPTQQREAEVIAALERGLQGALAAWIPEPPRPLPLGDAPWPGVHSELMRWGAAFPQQTGQPRPWLSAAKAASVSAAISSRGPASGGWRGRCAVAKPWPCGCWQRPGLGREQRGSRR